MILEFVQTKLDKDGQLAVRLLLFRHGSAGIVGIFTAISATIEPDRRTAMNWINGIQRAIDYIETHLCEELDYDEIARQSYSSSYHFQRIFSILCGYTLGEYIRYRRLTLAGTELMTDKTKIIDLALKYGYDSPDSFTRAFAKFHGVTPSRARSEGVMLRSFSRLNVKILLEGGMTMTYRIEKKAAMILVGYKKHFEGTPAQRLAQESNFYLSTRLKQYALKGMSRDIDTTYNVITDFNDDGYSFYIAAKMTDWLINNLEQELGEDAKTFERIEIPEQLYLVCETDRSRYPTMLTEELRRKAICEWLPSSEYELDEAPEITVNHWYFEWGNEPLNNSRYIELWIPIKKRA